MVTSHSLVLVAREDKNPHLLEVEGVSLPSPAQWLEEITVTDRQVEVGQEELELASLTAVIQADLPLEEGLPLEGVGVGPVMPQGLVVGIQEVVEVESSGVQVVETRGENLLMHPGLRSHQDLHHQLLQGSHQVKMIRQP